VTSSVLDRPISTQHLTIRRLIEKVRMFTMPAWVMMRGDGLVVGSCIRLSLLFIRRLTGRVQHSNVLRYTVIARRIACSGLVGSEKTAARLLPCKSQLSLGQRVASSS
jgi:hypothetical protein